MALTQAQWATTLKSWVPKWFFEEENYNEAVFQGFAKVLASLEISVDEHLAQTFIIQAQNSYLDTHGDERRIDRREGELDNTYSPRIRSLANTTSIPTIEELVNALLDVGTCIIKEDYDSQAFFNRDNYLNRGDLLFDYVKNTFSIIVDRQVHQPYSFLGREYFLDREAFFGTNESSLELFDIIVETVNRAKAFGCLYRLVERLES